MELFDRDRILLLVQSLAEEIAVLEIRFQIYIIGGAAVSISFNPDRNTTADIDAQFSHDPRIIAIINRIAEREGLQSDWINSKAGNRIPFPSYGYPWHIHSKNEFVTVLVADADVLIAMKLNANRGRRDLQDLPPLINSLQISTLKEVEEIYDRFYSQELIPSDGREFLEDYFRGAGTN